MNILGYISVCLAVIVGMVIVFGLFAHKAHQRDVMMENLGKIAQDIKSSQASIKATRIALDSIMGLPRSILVSPDDHSYIRVHYKAVYCDTPFDLKLFYRNDMCYDFVLTRR